MLKPFTVFAAALLLQSPYALAQGTLAPTSGGVAPACVANQGKLDEKGFVAIGGIEQWITVKGDSCANPVILFVHGGPGNPLSPYSDNMFGAWNKDFTIVQWDQRGAGMTYGRSKPAEDSKLTIKQMSDDGAEVVRYLAQRFGKKKVILWGSSWGSILGVHMAKAHPELFHAYLGTAQLVNKRDNEAASYAKLMGLVRAADDKVSLAVLEGVGAPPWTDPRSFGKVRRLTRKYEAKVSTPAPESWWKMAADYTTPNARADYEAGEEYSFINFVGMKDDGMLSQLDLPKLGTDFAIPMFFIEGVHDLVAPPELAQRYYDSIRAPQKGLVLLERVGHDPNEGMMEAQYRLLKERILPLTK